MKAYILSFIISITLVLNLTATETDPVIATMQIIPPYTPFLSDYVQAGVNKINYTMILTDNSEPSYQSRLKVTINGPGITIQTSNNYFAPPIILNYNVPVILSGMDLAGYFDPNHLDFSGISKNQFIQNGGRLPEGTYNICIETYDYRRDEEVPISNTSCSSLWLVEHDPPMIISPSGSLPVIDPQNMVFQWQPMHVGAFPVDYQIEIWEKVPGLATNLIITNTLPVYQGSQNMTSKLYGPTEPLLVPGGEYIFRVKANDITGANYFKNEGYSEIKSFVYGTSCEAPQEVQTEVLSPTSAKLAWLPPTGGSFSEYLVRYRNAAISNANWYEDLVQLTEHTITDLTENTSYEFQVKSVCSGSESDWNNGGEFTTDDEPFDPAEFACGDSITVTNVNSDTQLAAAQQGDEFKVFGFRLVLGNVSGGNGTFSGNGALQVPFIGSWMAASFSNIKVNAEGEVYEGDVITESDGLESFPGIDSLSVVIGGDICQPDPEEVGGFDDEGNFQPSGLPYNQYGFDANGFYVGLNGEVSPSDSLLYSPNGFDGNGIDPDTGTPYNEEGCDQNGLDANGQPCDPWPSPSAAGNTNDPLSAPITDAGAALANEIGDGLRPKIEAELDELTLIYQDSVETLQSELQTIRNALLGKVNELGFSPTFIFGPDSEYLEEGMSRYFDEAPTLPQGPAVDRNDDVEELEAKHIELYYLDLKLVLYFQRLDLIQLMKTENSLDGIELYLNELIKRFPTEDASQYSEDSALRLWIGEQVLEQLQNNFGFNNLIPETNEEDNSSGSIDSNKNNDARWGNATYPKKKRWNEKPKGIEYDPAAGLLAFNLDNTNGVSDIERQLLMQAMDEAGIGSESVTGISVYEEFNSGAEYINGIHRSILLDEMVRMKTESRQGVSSSPTEPATFPHGITKEIAGQEYTIVLDGMKVSPDGAVINVFFALTIPNTGEKVAFRAYGIGVGPTGITANDSRLELASDVGVRLSNAARLTFKGTENTYVSWDCGGFQGMGIDAEIEFCREYLIPINPTTNKVVEDEGVLVKAYFMAEMPAWGEFIADISMDPFAVKGLEDMTWVVQNAVFDFSESETPAIVTFPQNYESALVNGTNGAGSPLWKGFYLKQLSVTLPEKMTKGGNSSTPLTIGAEDVIIDGTGFTGTAFAEGDIISLGEGNVGGWAFSMNEISVRIQSNQFEEVKFGGKINVPIFSGAAAEEGSSSDPDENADSEEVNPASCFEYMALIQPGGNYQFSVSPAGELRASIWKANVSIAENSSLQINYIDDEFTVLATLHGNLSVDGSIGSGGDRITLPSVSFTNLVLGNRDPYFSPGQWNITGNIGAKFGNFELVINNLGLTSTSTPGEVGFNIGALFKLTGDDLGIAAGGDFTIIGNMVENNSGRQKWKYDRIKVNELMVDVSCPGFAIYGLLTFYEEDPVFGKGFRGMISAGFKGVGDSESSLGIAAMAQFGKKDDFKYFFVDAMVNFGQGLPIGPGVMLKGFGGGVYYHMVRQNISDVQLPEVYDGGGDPLIPALGTSLSGIRYIPDANSGIGIKATIVIATAGSDKAFNANATFEINFNTSGGINFIGIYGSAQFMSTINWDGGPSTAAVRADLDMYYDFVNDVLHAQVDAYINVAGALTGAGPNNLAGSIVLHFEPDDWYIYIGTPDQRLGLNLTIPGINLNLITVGTYMDIGTQIPPMPDLPANVQSITGAGNFMRNESAYATGKGFAFGASLDIDTGDKTFLIFYGRFALGMGFDIMLQDYGEIACVNGDSDGDIGINGWYASGQAWAYVQGEIGLSFKLFGKNKKFEIISLGAAAVLQAKLPNPFWGRGAVGGYYSVLGGLVSGQCNFSVEFGQECQLPGTGLDGIDIISDISPREGNTDVSVFTKPQVAFNIKVNDEFTLLDEEGQTDLYRASLESVRLLNEGTEIQIIDQQWNAANDVVALKTFEILPGNATLTLEAKVVFQERANGAWQNVIENGQAIYELKSATFTTGPAPDHIPHENVAFSYPVIDQFNFYKDEYNNGYVILEQGQSYLFEDMPSTEWAYEARITENGADQPIGVSDVSYDAAEKTVNFPLPAGMGNDRIYKLEFMFVPLSTNQAADANAVTTTTDATGDGSANVASNTLDGSMEELVEQDFYTSHYRASVHNTFSDKIDNLQMSEPWTLPIMEYNGLHELGTNVTGGELFDRFEINPLNNKPPLITYEASLYNSWYQDQVKPLVYDHFPNPNVSLTWRGTNIYGAVPKEAVYIRQNPDTKVLTQDEIDNQYTGGISDFAAFVYDLPYYMYRDYYDYKAQVANLIVNMQNPPDSYMTIANSPFPPITSGTYPININYKLPGKDIITTSWQVVMDKN